MKKFILFTIIFTYSLFLTIAGDVATFVDKGFSEDGKYYVFGQYGKTDKKFQGWAEIYQVDILENDFVNSGIFKTKPSSVTENKNGQEVYNSLEGKNFYYLNKLNCKPADIDHVLYILDDVNKTGTESIVFTDFRGSQIEKPNSFNITLIPTINGSGKSLKSSFYIELEKKDFDGNVIAKKQIGSPKIQRKGVKNYKIERIFCDNSEQKLIFIIEKIIEDETGISIRYMVETTSF